MALAFAGFFVIFVAGFFARLILFRALLVFLTFLLASLFARVLACFVHFAALLALFAGVRTSLVAGLYIVC